MEIHTRIHALKKNLEIKKQNKQTNKQKKQKHSTPGPFVELRFEAVM